MEFQVIVLRFAGSRLSELPTKASVCPCLPFRALAQLFVLRDHIEVAGRGPS